MVDICKTIVLIVLCVLRWALLIVFIKLAVFDIFVGRRFIAVVFYLLGEVLIVIVISLSIRRTVITPTYPSP